MPSTPLRFRVLGWVGTAATTVELRDDALLPLPADGSVRLRLPGVLSAGIVDRHVHLGLVDRERLADSPVVAVDDLGWIPAIAAGWRRTPPAGVLVRIAGPFLAPPGGYPSGRSWAPDGAIREVGNATAAVGAVREVAAVGATIAKVTLHAGFPAWPPGVLEAVVRAAHDAGLVVTAHVEGPGSAEAALAAGVDALAHVPWTERLPDAVVRGFARSTTWISTLGLHSGPARWRALGNARRFVAAGGRLRYGTDMGNGPTPVGVNGPEVVALGRAGLAGDALLDALLIGRDEPLPLTAAVWSPGRMPEDARGVAAWFAGARRLRIEHLEEQP